MKTLTALFLAIASTSTYANSIYDDWEKVTVNVTEAVQHYGGQYTCYYKRAMFGVSPWGPFGNYYDDVYKSVYVNDSLVPRPVFIVPDIYAMQNSNGFLINSASHPYACTGIADLPTTYIEQKNIGTKIEYHPIQPFPTHASYEYANCGFGGDIGIRTGHLHIGGISNGTSVVIKDVTKHNPSTLYSGPVNSWISINFSEFGVKTLTAKIDDGSTYRFFVDVPMCSGSGDDPAPR